MSHGYRILSIDPGTENVGASIIEFADQLPPTVIDMAILTMNGPDRVVRFHVELSGFIKDHRPDLILVERQIPFRSGYACEIAVRMFASCESIACTVVEPSAKWGIDGADPYRVRKSKAVALISSLTSNGSLKLDKRAATTWNTILKSNGRRKRDDLADSILQSLYDRFTVPVV
jgi:Poxvirus A22 protein